MFCVDDELRNWELKITDGTRRKFQNSGFGTRLARGRLELEAFDRLSPAAATA